MADILEIMHHKFFFPTHSASSIWLFPSSGNMINQGIHQVHWFGANIWNCIWKVASLNLSWDSDYLECEIFFCGLPLSLQPNARIVPSLGCKCFIPNLFQLSYHSMLYILGYWQCQKKTPPQNKAINLTYPGLGPGTISLKGIGFLTWQLPDKWHRTVRCVVLRVVSMNSTGNV
jgi:hypothetical protein